MSSKSKQVLLRWLVLAGALMVADGIARPAILEWLSPVHGAQWICRAPRRHPAQGAPQRLGIAPQAGRTDC